MRGLMMAMAFGESGVAEVEPGSHPGPLDPVARWTDGGGGEAALSVEIPASWAGETWSVLVEWTLDAGAAEWLWVGEARSVAPGQGFSLVASIPEGVLRELPPEAHAAEVDLRAHVWVDAVNAGEGPHSMRYALTAAFVAWEGGRPAIRLEPSWRRPDEIPGVVLPPGIDPSRARARTVPAVEGAWPPALEDTGRDGGAP